MPVIQEPSGRRSVQVAFEVPGTPEQVWQAIATGPGISAWLVPAEVDMKDGKAVSMSLDFGPGMVSRSQVTAWDPPRTFTKASPGWVPGSPPIDNTWTVLPRDGGCTLRIEHSLVADTADWDGQLEATETGWAAFLTTLRIHLQHFAGQPCTMLKWMVPTTGPESQAWGRHLEALGLTDVDLGQRWATPAGLPACGGVVELKTERPFDALVRLDTPGPGVAALGTVDCGDQVLVGLVLYLYGDQAATTAARVKPLWQAWFDQTYPAPAAPA